MLEIFPNIFDTKLITEITDQSILGKIGKNSTGLGTLFTDTQDHELPKIKFEEEFTSYVSSNSCHEAGYDAYMTGFILLKLLQVIKPNFNFNIKEELLLEYKNTINLINCDYKLINLESDEEVIRNLDAKFHISNLPRNWRNKDIRKEFQIQGIHTKPRFLSKNSVILTIAKEKDKNIFIENFIKKKNNQNATYVIKYFKSYLQECIDFFN